jgi:hypothetical protein
VLSADVITFAGPVDDALPTGASDQLLDMLRAALGLISPDAVQTSVDLRAGDALTVIVTGTGPDWRPAGSDGQGRDFSPPARQGEPGRHRGRRRAGRGWHAAGLDRAGSLWPASSRSTLSPLGATRHRGPGPSQTKVPLRDG